MKKEDARKFVKEFLAKWTEKDQDAWFKVWEHFPIEENLSVLKWKPLNDPFFIVLGKESPIGMYYEDSEGAQEFYPTVALSGDSEMIVLLGFTSHWIVKIDANNDMYYAFVD